MIMPAENNNLETEKQYRSSLWRDGLGPVGPYQEKTSPYESLRLKRHNKYKKDINGRYHLTSESCEVRQKGKNAWNRTCWVSLGTFATENEAIKFLESRAELMRLLLDD